MDYKIIQVTAFIVLSSICLTQPLAGALEVEGLDGTLKTEPAFTRFEASLSSDDFAPFLRDKASGGALRRLWGGLNSTSKARDSLRRVAGVITNLRNKKFR